MTQREMATLACKILALWMFAQVAMAVGNIVLFAIAVIGSIFSNGHFGWAEVGMTSAITGSLVAGQGVIGLIFWFGARKIAGRMVSDESATSVGSGMTREGVMAVAFCAVGMFTFIPSLQGVFRHLFQIFGSPYHPTEKLWSNRNWEVDLWSAILGLVFSLWLIFGSRGIVRLVVWARSSAANRGDETLCEKCGYDLHATTDRCPECGTVPAKKEITS